MTGVPGATLPDAESIRQTAGEVLARDEYDLGRVANREPGMVWEFLSWIWEKLVAFSQLAQGLPTPLRWLLYLVLTALLVLLVWHIGYTLSRGLRVRERAPRAAQGGRSRDPRELERLAEEAFGRDEYVEAVRLLFRAAILRLENAEQRSMRPGLTNRELLRRYRATPVHSALRQFVEVLDLAWYGGHECRLADYQACRAAHDVVRAQARRVLPRAPGARSSPPVPASSNQA
jgi:hypothetical protein